jgi:hypothetical protein
VALRPALRPITCILKLYMAIATALFSEGARGTAPRARITK